MKTAISLPDPLFLAAERLARRLGLSRSALFQRALRELLEEAQDEGVTEALNRIYGPGRRAARVDPILDTLQLASLPKEEW